MEGEKARDNCNTRTSISITRTSHLAPATPEGTAEQPKISEADKKKREEELAQEQAAQQRLREREHHKKLAAAGPQEKLKKPIIAEPPSEIQEAIFEESSNERLFTKVIQEIRDEEELDSEFLKQQEEDMRSYFAANPRMTNQERDDYLLTLRLHKEERTELAREERDRQIREEQIRRGVGTSGVIKKPSRAKKEPRKEATGGELKGGRAPRGRG